MTGRSILVVAVLTLASIATALPSAVSGQALPSSVVPIPPAERTLPTILADRSIAVPGAKLDLEGPVFLPNGDLLFSDVQGGRVMRLDRKGHVTTVTKLAGLMPGGMAIGPNGRLYVAAATTNGGGTVIAMATDGTRQTTIVPETAGLVANDLVFDAHGGFYLTDARGSVGEAAGGVWYVAPRAAPVPVVRHLAVANGIALSPDGKQLWVGEFALGRLYLIDLKDATTPAPFGAVTAYHFTGPAPDSIRVDAHGRVYVCLYGQGRVLIFAPTGLPIAQIVLPDRDIGRNLHLTSLAIEPATGEIAIVASDGKPGGSANIFHARIP